MALFDDVFNPQSIFNMLFFNVKAVLIYPTLEELKLKNPKMYERWEYLVQAKKLINPIHDLVDNEVREYVQKIYEDNAIQYPEFSKIVAITYAKAYSEKGELKRQLKRIANDNEIVVIEQFMYVLDEISKDDSKSSPQIFSILCGHNIISYDIPFLMKRYMFNKKEFQTVKHLPYLLKRAFNVKPWESGIIDTVNVWKFNGFDYSPLMLIADFLGLKKTVDLLPNNELSKYYWQNFSEKPIETLEFVALQSATQTNLVIQLINELRQV